MKNHAVIMLALLFAGCVSASQDKRDDAQPNAYAGEQFPVRTVNRDKFDLRFQPTIVANTTGEAAGTIIVDTNNNYLYLVEENGTARRYGVAVGTSGHAWSGRAVVGRKAKWPAWHPTDDMHAQTPGLPRRVEPGPHNPLGARALYLFQNGKDTLYRIHGTSEPWTIGTKASSGCIRMFNEDIMDLYERTGNGAQVLVR
ncbi:MAG TPA: L,D-transpeptidase [Ochrobactrum sp.]|nr:L,D-transpeptidase [Ochrobactrum sp.]